MKKSILVVILAFLMVFGVFNATAALSTASLAGPGTINTLGDGGGSPGPGMMDSPSVGDGGGSPGPG